MWIKLVELQMSLSTSTMRQWTKEEGYGAVLSIGRSVLALSFTQKAPEHWLPCALLAMAEEGSCSSGCPAEDFVLLCSLARKGAFRKSLTLLMTLTAGVQLCLTGTAFGQYREGELALFSLEVRI